MSIIALSGNPNCGKTTLFNRLTNSRARVGNRAGVTVAPKRGSWGSHTLVDLPGIYSLEGSAAEERAAKSYIKSDKPERILNIIDATDLERSLWLTVQLANMQLPMTVALNMSDCLEREGYSIDIKTLAKRLGVPVILISASSGAGVHELAAAGACVPNKIPSPRSWIAETVELVLKKEGEGRLKKSIAADRILLGKFTALPILTAAFAIIFLLTFGSLGRGLGDVFERVYSGFEAFIQGFLIDLEVNPFLYGLICDGLIKAAGSVVPFFGQIIILFFLLSILEDVGYMSRVVFITDRVMERAGLDGRAVLPLITGFGCSVPAVMTAQNIDDREKRKRTIKLLPFVSCSAKMPVYIIFAGAFFPVHQGAAAAALYFLGLGAAAVYAFFQKRYAQKNTAPFVMELPPYRCPTLKNTLNRLWDKLSDFIKRVGSVLFIAGVAVWLLESFDPALRMTDDPEKSILGTLGKLIAPLFAPCGFGNWQAAVSLLSGLLAKEAVVSTLNVVYAPDVFSAGFSTASAAAFLTFVLFYPPCAAALSAMSAELSKRETAALLLRQLAAAWVSAVLVYFVLGMFL